MVVVREKELEIVILKLNMSIIVIFKH